MTAATLPLQLLLLTVSGWVHRHQQDVIAYLVEENRVLKEQLRGRKLRIDLKTRRAHVAGLTTTPDGAFIARVARNVTDPADGFLRAHRFVICDRDAKFTAEFRHILQVVGVEVILTPRHAPNCNAHAERVFEDLRTAPHVYLLPEYEDAESEREVLEDFWPELFAAMLTCWLTDEQQWPKDRTREMFREWFDVQMYPAVDDLHLDEELVELD